MTTANATFTTSTDRAAEERQRRIVRKAIAKQSFLTLATSSVQRPTGRTWPGCSTPRRMARST